MVLNDRPLEALHISADLHGQEARNNTFVHSEFEEIKLAVHFEKQAPPPSYYNLIFGKQYRRRTALGIGVQFMQQVSGINVVLYYAAKVFARTGRTALLANGISSALFLLASLSLTLIIEYYSRRKPLNDWTNSGSNLVDCS